MTKSEFDRDRFGKYDEIVVRSYFRSERERVEWEDFEERLVNGHKAASLPPCQYWVLYKRGPLWLRERPVRTKIPDHVCDEPVAAEEGGER